MVGVPSLSGEAGKDFQRDPCEGGEEEEHPEEAAVVLE